MEPPLLLLVGTRTDDVFHGALEQIDAAVAASGTSSLVHWLGFVPDEELRKLMSGAQALLLAVGMRGFRPARGRSGRVRHAGHRDDSESAPAVACRRRLLRRAARPACAGSGDARAQPTEVSRRDGPSRARACCPTHLDLGGARRARVARRGRGRATTARGAGGDRMTALRFCMLTTFYPPYSFGGDAIGVQRLARGLVRAGHEVTVVHDVDAYHALHPGAPPNDGEGADGVEVIPLRSGLRTLSPLLTQQTGRPIVHGRADSASSGRTSVRCHQLPQRLADRRAGNSQLRRAGGTRVHGARALARLSYARALAARAGALFRTAVRPVLASRTAARRNSGARHAISSDSSTMSISSSR